MQILMLLVSAFIIITTGCNNDTVQPENVLKNLSPNAQKSVDVFLKFRAEMKPTASRGEDDLIIDKIVEIDVPISTSEEKLAGTLSRSDSSIDLNVKLHSIIFHSEGNEGFSIVTGDECVRSLFVYCDKGTIEDSAYIYPVAEYLKHIPQLCADDLYLYYYGEPDDARISSRANEPAIGPLVYTQWSQGFPYNLAIANINCGGATKRPDVGCTPLALVQCMIICTPPTTQF